MEILGRFEIRGRLYSKKNSSNIAVVNGRPMVLGNPRYHRTKNEYKEQLLSACEPGIHGPLVLYLTLWGNNERWMAEWSRELQPEKYSGWDVDNKLHSVGDLLTYSGIIHDDCQFMEAHCRKVHGKAGHGDYGCLGVIARFTEENPAWPS